MNGRTRFRAVQVYEYRLSVIASAASDLTFFSETKRFFAVTRTDFYGTVSEAETEILIGALRFAG